VTPRIIAANLVVRLRSLGREKSAMFFTIAFPIILVLVFGAIFTTSERLNLGLPVQDLDQTASSAQLIERLADEGVFEVIPVPTDADPVAHARDHKLNLLLVIPRGFEEQLLRRVAQGDTSAGVVLTYIHDPSSTSLQTKLQYLNAMVVAANQQMHATPPFITLQEKSILANTYRFIDFFVPGIIAMAVMMSSMGGALNMNAELRQKGVLRKLATTPIRPTDWLLSNILYQLILATVSTIAILLVAYAVYDVRLNINYWLPVYIVVEVFAFVGIGMLLTPLAKEAESAVAASNAFLLPMMFLSGTFFPVEMMPGFLQAFARALPLYYVNEGLRASMIFSDGVTAAIYAAILAGVAAVVFVAGAVVTRWGREG
jgi:ABC-2 type transport system permease protein